MAISFASSAASAGGTSEGSFDRGPRGVKSYAAMALCNEAVYPRRRVILSRALALTGVGGSFGATLAAPSALRRLEPHSWRAACNAPSAKERAACSASSCYLSLASRASSSSRSVSIALFCSATRLSIATIFCSARCNAALFASDALASSADR